MRELIATVGPDLARYQPPQRYHVVDERHLAEDGSPEQQSDCLATGFGPSNPALAHVIDDFLAQPDNLAKGPYLSIALPLQPAPEGGEPFPEVPLGFTPYRDQRTAFSRLAAGVGAELRHAEPPA